MKKFIKYLIFCVLLANVAIIKAQHFQPVWTTPFNPMTIFVLEAKINDSNLQAGDEIGVFDIDPNTGNQICVGAIILDEEITPEDFAEVICSMDDGLGTDFANGFTQGNNFIFRFWIAAYDVEVENVGYDFPYPGYDENFAALGTSIVSLSAITQQQVINLPQGWYGISSYLEPENPEIVTMMGSISEQLIILKNMEGYYWPEGNVNTLLNWDYTKGYIIKVDSPVQFNIKGTIPENKTIQLAIGWNLIPVLSENNVNVAELFAGIDLVIVKEVAGWCIYWPEMGINNLEYLQSGKAYFVLMNTETTITFP